MQNAQKTDNSRKTFFRDIFQLLPGECMLYSNQNIRISRWYDLSKNVRNINNEESNIKKELNSELEKAITLNNRSDAKIAISLSGGLDSNTLLSFYKNSDTLKNIPQCYSVFFLKNFWSKKI